jgi:hypothetical protein
MSDFSNNFRESLEFVRQKQAEPERNVSLVLAL